MASENIERQMEFILQEQGRGAPKLGQLEDIVVRFAQATRDRFDVHNQRFDDVDQKIAALVDSQVRAEERGHEIDKRISALVESQLRTEENVKRTDENVKNTEANIKTTDEALRKLIATVDRHLSEGRNGNSKV